ncbi:MAG TPA: sugar transferase [Duganella sp.]|jgi:lipopolysaccharide/colanic/teichoic acid biosynthesis glycosyltransferase/peptidoglycan/LPS O-acetylase OafA/YrhL
MLTKRVFDLAAALAGLLLLAPVMTALALWIKWDSPGPVLFRQQRVGRNGVLFSIYKFRTMRAFAEDGGQLSLADDERATGAGRLLRRHKLDELPQLFNVLLGDMSLVGPRPEVPRYVAHYPAPVRDIVLSVRPGITDWAAIHFRDEGEILRRAADPEQAYLLKVLPIKLDYYQRYVRQRGLLMDLRIIWCTVRVLLFGGSVPAAEPRGANAALAPATAPETAPANAPAVAPANVPAAGRSGVRDGIPAATQSATRLPRARLLAESRLGPHDWQSLLISLVRGMAALQVAAAHLRAQVLPDVATLENPPPWYVGLSLVTGFAHQAVVLFFVLSGWLIGGALLDRIGTPHALRDYAIDRVTRLWVVLVPAFALMLLLGLGTGELDADAPRLSGISPWSLTTLLGNLAGVQTMLVPPFGGNFPLWSLAYETWYYVLFPLLALSLIKRPGNAQVRLAAASAVVVLALCLSSGILLYFTIWLMGAAASRIRLDLGRLQQTLCWLLFGAVALGLRLHGQDGDMDMHALWRDALYSALFLLCLCGAGRRNPASMRPLAALATFFAGFSFTLYVMHVPLLHMLSAYRGGGPLSVDDTASMVVYASMLAIVVSLSYLLHLPFEAQTHRLRRFIKQFLPGAASRKLGMPVAGGAG